jgi:hypothetical protein
MKKPESFTMTVNIDLEQSLCEMFDIAQELNYIVSLVDGPQAYFAEESKQRIMDTLITWIDCNEKGE